MLIAIFISVFYHNLLNTGLETCHNRDYEVGLAILNFCESSVTRETRNEYFFYRAVATHQLTQKEAARNAASALLDSFDPIPSRYIQLANGILDDIEKWDKGGPLTPISRKMGGVERRLGLAKGGEETQRQQKSILEDLDKLIKEKEDNKKKVLESVNSGDKKGLPNGKSSSPADNSELPKDFGKGEVSPKTFKKIAENWGGLPPSERRKVAQEISNSLPPKHRAAIEAYFKELNRLP